MVCIVVFFLHFSGQVRLGLANAAGSPGRLDDGAAHTPFASVTGLSRITFLIAWFGSVANWVLENGWGSVSVQVGLLICASTLSMAAVLYEPAFAVVATWFVRQRGRALTLLTFIAGLASVICVPLAAWLVQSQG